MWLRPNSDVTLGASRPFPVSPFYRLPRAGIHSRFSEAASESHQNGLCTIEQRKVKLRPHSMQPGSKLSLHFAQVIPYSANVRRIYRLFGETRQREANSNPACTLCNESRTKLERSFCPVS